MPPPPALEKLVHERVFFNSHVLLLLGKLPAHFYRDTICARITTGSKNALSVASAVELAPGVQDNNAAPTGACNPRFSFRVAFVDTWERGVYRTRTPSRY